MFWGHRVNSLGSGLRKGPLVRLPQTGCDTCQGPYQQRRSALRVRCRMGHLLFPESPHFLIS